MTASALLFLAPDESDTPSGEWAAPRESFARSDEAARARVLIVDDEPIVLSFVARLLEEAGYQVHAAPNGAEALQIATSEWREFDLVITDVRMPSLDGWELGRLLRERWPGLPILYVSGYDVGGTTPRASAFLRKPFDPAELLRQVAGLLEGR